MRNLKRTLSLMLTLCMLLSLFAVSASAAGYKTLVNDPSRYTDIKGHWAEEALTNALANGVMYGTTSTTVSPDDPITRAQMGTLIVRAFEATKTSNISSFVDVDKDSWYYSYLSQAVQMGIISGNGNSMFPNSKITRQEAACVFCRAFNLYGYSANLNQYSDSGSIASYARDPMAACVGAGIMTASDGKLNPTKELTRAEFTYAMYRIVQNYVSSQVPFTGEPAIQGSMMVTTPNITLTNTAIAGNLYVGDGVENGSLTLDNVQVSGTIYVRGSSKLFLNNRSTANSIVVFNPSYAVSVEIDKTSSTRSAVVDTAISGVTFSGNVGDVTMNTAKAVLSLKSATVGTLNANVILPTITVDKDTTIADLRVPSVAEGAKVTVDGKVHKADFSANSVDLSCSKGSILDFITVSGDSGNYKFSSITDEITLSDKASDNKLDFNADCEVDSFAIDSANDNEITVASGADMAEILFNQAKSRMSLTLKAPDVRIGGKANNSKFTFSSGTDIDELTVDADDVSIVVSKGASIDTIIVNGDGVDISGKGTVGSVVLKRGATDASIDTPNTKVENNSGGSANVGGDRLPSGSTGTTDDNGDLEETDGNKPGNKPGDKPDTEDPNKTYDSAFSLRYPSDATPLDIYGSGAFSLSALVLGGGYDQTTNQLSGTVRPVSNFSPMLDAGTSATGFYFPLALYDSSRTTDFTVTVGSKTYTQADVSIGPNYRNILIFFVPLDQADYSKKVTVTYDADGSGTKYRPTSVNLFFAGVQFEKDETIAKRMALVKGASDIGSGTVKVDSFTQGGDTICNYNLSSEGVLSKATNQQGTEGYWGGVTIYGPADAMLVSYTVTTDKGVEEFNSGLVLESDRTSFDYYHDMQNCNYMNLQVQWKNGSSQPIGVLETYNFNLTNVSTQGGNGGEIVQPDAVPVATSIVVSEFPADALLAESGKAIMDYATAYNVTNTNDGAAIAGTYKKVNFGSGSSRLPGYYVPLSVVVRDLKCDALLLYSTDGNTFNQLERITLSQGGTSPESQDIHVLVPLSALGSQVKNFTLQVKPTGTFPAGGPTYTAVEKQVNCAQAAVDTTAVLMSKVSSGTFFGKALNELVTTGYDVVANGTGYDFRGTYSKVTLDASANAGVTNLTGWFAPVRVSNTLDSGETWSVTVTSPKGKVSDETDVKVWDCAANQSTCDIAVPLGYYVSDDDCAYYNRVTVLVKDSEGNTLATYYIDASSCTLDGAPEGMNGVGIGGDVVVAPAKPSIQVMNTGNVDNVDVSNMVASTITNEDGVLKGTLKKFQIADTSEGWAVPMTITLDKDAGALWSVEITSTMGNASYGNINTTSRNIMVPVGKVASDHALSSDTKVSTVKVTVKGIKDATADTFFTFTVGDDLILDGFTEQTTTPPSTEDPAVSVSIAAGSEDTTVGTLGYADLIESDFSVAVPDENEPTKLKVTGSFKRAELSSGKEGWAAPVVVTLDKALTEGWTVEVTPDGGDVSKSETTDASQTSLAFLVPLGEWVDPDSGNAGDVGTTTPTSSVVVTVKDKSGKIIATYTFDTSAVSLVNSNSTGDAGEGTTA